MTEKKTDESEDDSSMMLRLPVYPFREGVLLPTVLEDFPDHAKVIGCFIAEYTVLEFKLATLAMLHSGEAAPMVIPMIFAVESSSARLESMRGAFAVLFSDDTEKASDLDTIVTDAKKLLNQRNSFAHALYGKTASGELTMIKAITREETVLPLHSLTYQLERVKVLSERLGQLNVLRHIEIGSYEMLTPERGGPPPKPPSQMGSTGGRSRQKPPRPPKPSRP